MVNKELFAKIQEFVISASRMLYSFIAKGEKVQYTCMHAFDSDPDIKGIHYIFNGEREFYIEIKGMLTPVTLTVESYH